MAEHPYYDGIEAALLADTTEPAAATLVSGRIYADQLPNDSELPAIRMAVITDNPAHRLSNGDSTTGTVQCDVYAKRGDSSTAWAIDRAIHRVLKRAVITVVGFNNVQVQCLERGKPMKEDGYYRITSRYKLFGSAA